MKRSGLIVQIIKNNKIGSYMMSRLKQDSIIETGLDVVVLRNPEYPTGLKGYLLSFKNSRLQKFFPILMRSTDLKEGQVINVECKPFFTKTELYIQVKQ